MSDSELHTQEFIQIFLDEAKDMLVAWEKCCLDLERNHDQEKVDALFRSAHNLKGSARSVGLEAFAGFVHKAEDVISLLRSRSIVCTPALLKVLLNVQSMLSKWIDALGFEPTFIPQAEMSQCLLSLSQSAKAIVIASPASDDFIDFSLPDPEVPQNIGEILVASGAATKEQVAEAARLQQRKIGEILVDQGVVKKSVVEHAAVVQGAKSASKLTETIRVSSTKIDALMQIVGELSTQQAIVAHSRRHHELEGKNCLNAILICSKLVKELQHQTLGLRMQPLTSLFQRLERTARDLGRDLQKPLEIMVDGDQVEMDKSIIERITDTMVHIVRNAVDHGIESSGQRSPAGKSEVAQIQFSACHDANGVTIRVKDDGRGIDRDRVTKKALANGLISDTSNLSDSEIYGLLFLAGFSTAEKVSEVSGRGVGLDVVKRSIDALAGSITIDSALGKGSTFTISLPTSVSIIDALVVNIAAESYVVPIHEIDEVIDLATYRVEMMTNSSPMIMLRNRVVAVRRLDEYLPLTNAGRPVVRSLAIGPGAEPNEQRKAPAFVVESAGNRVAFGFDQIIGQQSIVVRPLSPNIAQIPGYKGSTVLANGEPALIISLREYARQYISKAQGAS